MAEISIKRIYEKPDEDDGYRVLIDRIWPRGISKENAKLNEWKKDIAPSNELRKWFNHEPELYPEFNKRYREELSSQGEAISELLKIARSQKLTLLYGAKDESHNQAVVLKEVLEEHY